MALLSDKPGIIAGISFEFLAKMEFNSIVPDSIFEPVMYLNRCRFADNILKAYSIRKNAIKTGNKNKDLWTIYSNVVKAKARQARKLVRIKPDQRYIKLIEEVLLSKKEDVSLDKEYFALRTEVIRCLRTRKVNTKEIPRICPFPEKLIMEAKHRGFQRNIK